MSYTTNELSQMTGYSSATITSTLERLGYTHIDIGEHGLKIWDDESLKVLLEKKNTIVVKEEIGIAMVAAKFNLTNECIRERAKRYGIEPLYYKKSVEIYPYTIYEVIRQHLENSKVADADKHPLVKDKRCLELGWFPDTVPKCFEDL